MAKIVYFNRGMAKGKLVKSEVINYEKNGKKGEFLALEVEAGSGNRIKATIFPTQANPRKHLDIEAQYPVGSYVEVSGNAQEREFENKNGGKSVDRSISAFSVRDMKDDATEVAVFVLHGIVDSIKETSNGTKVALRISNNYEKDGKVIERPDDVFTLETPKELTDEYDITKGCNAKFKGRILNELLYDDYGDIIGSTKMFLIEKVENIIDADDLIEVEDEDLPF